MKIARSSLCSIALVLCVACGALPRYAPILLIAISLCVFGFFVLGPYDRDPFEVELLERAALVRDKGRDLLREVVKTFAFVIVENKTVYLQIEDKPSIPFDCDSLSVRCLCALGFLVEFDSTSVDWEVFKHKGTTRTAFYVASVDARKWVALIEKKGASVR